MVRRVVMSECSDQKGSVVLLFAVMVVPFIAFAFLPAETGNLVAEQDRINGHARIALGIAHRSYNHHLNYEFASDSQSQESALDDANAYLLDRIGGDVTWPGSDPIEYDSDEHCFFVNLSIDQSPIVLSALGVEASTYTIAIARSNDNRIVYSDDSLTQCP